MVLKSLVNLTSLVLFIPVLIFLILQKWKKPKSLTIVKTLPPGPRKLPIIGDLHRLNDVPFRSFRYLANKYGPIIHLKLGEVRTIVISSPEIAKLVLKEHEPCFADRFGSIAMKIMWYDYIDIAFCQYSEYWKQMRMICVKEMLSTKNVRSFGYIRNEEVSRLIQSIKLYNGKPMNLTKMFFSLVSSITCRAAFGKVCKDNDTLIALGTEAIDMAVGFCMADLFPSSRIINSLSWGKTRLLKMRQKLDVILDEIINEHKTNLAHFAEEDGKGNSKKRGNGDSGNEDLVDVLLRVNEEQTLQFVINNDNIKAIIFDMTAAGTETSATALDWTMTELIRHPRIMKKVQDEVRGVFRGVENVEEKDLQKLKYLKLVVKESLRLHPPSPIVPRASREEATIHGYTIPANTRVLVNTWAIQRDPKYWENPEIFEPERFEKKSVDYFGENFSFLPFGSGRRMCPGTDFAFANIELPLAQLLYNFNWKLPDGVNPQDLNMIEKIGLSASRKNNLFIVATPYKS